MCNSEVNLHTCSKTVTTGSDSDLNETSLSRDVMAVDYLWNERPQGHNEAMSGACAHDIRTIAQRKAL